MSNNFKVLNILLASDNESYASTLLTYLSDPKSHRFNIIVALTEKDFRNQVQGFEISAVIIKHPFKGDHFFDLLKERNPTIPYIIYSDISGEESAVKAMKAGADGYIFTGNPSKIQDILLQEINNIPNRKERRLSDTLIKQSKAELEGVFDSVSELIVLTDMSDNIVRCNRKVTEYLKVPYRNLIGEKAEETFFGEMPPDNNPFHSPGLFPPDNDKEIWIEKLGRWFNAACTHLVTADTTQFGFVYTLTDITRRKLAEEEKKLIDKELLTLYAVAFRMGKEESYEKILDEILFQLHNMLNLDSSAIFLIKSDCLKPVASFGSISTLISELKPSPDFLDAISISALTSRDHNNLLPNELSSLSGSKEWAIFSLKPAKELKGMMVVYFNAENNISERSLFLLSSVSSQLALLVDNLQLYEQMKEKADELQKSRTALAANLEKAQEVNQELKRLNSAKNNFIGMASHELKTPITSILGGLQFLLQYCGLPLTPEQSNIFNSVYESVLQLKSIVDDLLSISRIETKGYSLQRREININKIASETVEIFRIPALSRNLSISVEGERATVTADESFCRLVLRNLIENAIKFTEDGGFINIGSQVINRNSLIGFKESISSFYPEFPLNLPASNRYLLVEINDSGVGMPENEMLRIFDKFYSIGDISYHFSGKTDYLAKGSGLGLSIVKGIVDAHGGLVWASSGKEGKGSCFSFVLPMMVPVERELDEN